MNHFKSAITLMSFTTLSLFVFLFTLQNPLDTNYQRTVNKLMETYSYQSEAELLLHHPEIEIAKNKIAELKLLAHSVHSLTEGPAPAVSPDAAKYINATRTRIHTLEKEINELLKRAMNQRSSPLSFLVF